MGMHASVQHRIARFLSEDLYSPATPDINSVPNQPGGDLIRRNLHNIHESLLFPSFFPYQRRGLVDDYFETGDFILYWEFLFTR